MTRPDWMDCEHEQTEVRARMLSNGTVVHMRQCLRCGGNRGCVKKTDGGVPAFDEALRQRWLDRESAYYEQRQHEHETRQGEFWRRYDEYLRGPVWGSKKARVLRRDGYMCQACQDRSATQVHHLTYAHVFDEPLFDLISVCEICHKRLTEYDRERRGVTASAA